MYYKGGKKLTNEHPPSLSLWIRDNAELLVLNVLTRTHVKGFNKKPRVSYQCHPLILLTSTQLSRSSDSPSEIK